MLSYNLVCLYRIRLGRAREIGRAVALVLGFRVVFWVHGLKCRDRMTCFNRAKSEHFASKSAPTRICAAATDVVSGGDQTAGACLVARTDSHPAWVCSDWDHRYLYMSALQNSNDGGPLVFSGWSMFTLAMTWSVALITLSRRIRYAYLATCLLCWAVSPFSAY